MKKNLKQGHNHNNYIYEEKKDNIFDENINLNPPNLQINGIINDLKRKGYNDFQIKDIISSIQKNNNVIKNRVINYYINEQENKNPKITMEQGQKMKRNNSYQDNTQNKHQRNKYNNYNTKIYISKNVNENRYKLLNDIIPKKKISEKIKSQISKPLLIAKNEYILSNKKNSQNNFIENNNNIIKRNRFNDCFNDIKNNFNNYSFYYSNDKKSNSKDIKNYINDYGKKIYHKGKKILKYKNKEPKKVENTNINNIKDNKIIKVLYLNKNNKRINSKSRFNTIENFRQDRHTKNNINFNDSKNTKKGFIMNEDKFMDKQKSYRQLKNNLFYNYVKHNYSTNPSFIHNDEQNIKANNYKFRPINNNIKKSKYNNYIFHNISKEGSTNNSISKTSKNFNHYNSNICIKKSKYKEGDLYEQNLKNEKSANNINFNNESPYESKNAIQYKYTRLNKKKLSNNNISQKIICDLNYHPKKKESVHNTVNSLSVEQNTISIVIEPSYKKDNKIKNLKNKKNVEKERKKKENTFEISRNQNLKIRNNSENQKSNKLIIEKNEINYISNRKRFKDGLYEGIIINGKREIKGIMKYKNGSKYEGQWKNDKRHGKGIYTTQNYNNPNYAGILYEGEFNNDKIEGYGIGKYSSGDQYEGEWKNNKQYGRGILNYIGGGKYVGEWKYGKLNGEGIYYLKIGERFEGKFIDNKYNGYGKYYYINGEYLEGIFRDDLPSGHCILHKTDGTTEDKYFN